MSMDAQTERRREWREPPILPGPAEIPTSYGQLDVSVANVSPSGIMLKVPEAAPLPDLFNLVIGGRRHPCQLIWRKGSRAGARLIGSRR
ncbi:PilZ domain-containing protein [Devosia sp. CC-YST696]|nr:PilZ domain-containing protein [Devosia faecipullorum]